MLVRGSRWFTWFLVTNTGCIMVIPPSDDKLLISSADAGILVYRGVMDVRK